MNDGALLAAGCAVTFIALCGAYVYLRERSDAAVRAAAIRVRSEEERRRRDLKRVA